MTRSGIWKLEIGLCLAGPILYGMVPFPGYASIIVGLAAPGATPLLHRS